MIFYLEFSKIQSINYRVGEVVSTLQPFIVGFSFAYIFNFILKFYEKYLFEIDSLKDVKSKARRIISIVFTYATVALIVVIFVKILFPQLMASITGLINDVPTYVRSTTNWLDDLLKSFDIKEEYLKYVNTEWQKFVEVIMSFAEDLIPRIGLLLANVLSSIWNIVLGIIISVYLLIDKERYIALCKKILFASFSEKHSKKIIEIMQRTNDTFGKFISGKIIDSFIIWILTFIVLSIVKMPYALLISVIVGVTNIIPFFGPFMGAIPSIIIVMFVSPIMALWLAGIILVIQQLDGNIIGPKILGDSIGISAFWILFAILVAGKLFGIIGMVIGVPLFAMVYSLIKEFVEYKLKLRGLPEDTESYIDI
jgi:predicted PurR-regulated permease PerM